MYFSHMRPDQQEVLLALLANVMAADHEILPEERRHLKMIQVDNGLTERSFEDLIRVPLDSAELRSAFDSPAIRVVAALEILEMAYADGSFHLAEQDVFYEFARSLDLPPKEVDSLAYLVKRYVDDEQAKSET